MKHIVIIPIFNELDTVKVSLGAYIKNTDHSRCSTYLIDDGSDTETADYVKAMAKKHGLNLLRNQKNIGKPKSINRVIHANKDADFFTVIDSDMVVKTPRWNRVLEKAHGAWKNQAILGVKLDLVGYEFKRGGMTFGDLFPFWTLPGGFFSIPSSVFNKLGYFYDKVRRHEDAEYCRRAATQRIEWYYTSDIKTTILSHVSFANNPLYVQIKERELNIYKKRSLYIMQSHKVYYSPF